MQEFCTGNYEKGHLFSFGKRIAKADKISRIMSKISGRKFFLQQRKFEISCYSFLHFQESSQSVIWETKINAGNQAERCLLKYSHEYSFGPILNTCFNIKDEIR